MGIDLQKEIKLSDLFRRKAKQSEESPKQAKPPKEPRRPLFARKEKGAEEPKAPKAPKGEKAPRTAPKAAPAPPAVPLMRAFNLLPKEEARESRSGLGLAQVLVALAGLLVVAGLGSGYLFMGARAADRQAQVDDLRVQLADLDVPAEEPGDDDGADDPALAAQSQARTTSLAAALAARVAWDRVLREVTLVVPEEVWLSQVIATTPAAAAGGTQAAEPAAGGNSITIVGRAESQEAVARFLARLGVIPELSAVRLQSSAAEAEDGVATVFAFTIVASVNPQGSAS